MIGLKGMCHRFMDASVLEYCWEPEAGSKIKISPEVELFVFFLAIISTS